MKFSLKMILLVIAAVFLLVVSYFLLMSRSKSPSDSPPENVGTTGTSTGSISKFPTGNLPAFSVPSKDASKMTITTQGGNIETNNLYANPVETLPGDGVAFVENDSYHMSFYPKNQGLLITIIDPDIQAGRDKAEQNLLDSLDVTKEQACQLTVDLGVPASVSLEAAGQNYGLS